MTSELFCPTCLTLKIWRRDTPPEQRTHCASCGQAFADQTVEAEPVDLAPRIDRVGHLQRILDAIQLIEANGSLVIPAPEFTAVEWATRSRGQVTNRETREDARDYQRFVNDLHPGADCQVIQRTIHYGQWETVEDVDDEAVAS